MIIHYYGESGSTIEINSPLDVYGVLDWLHSQLLTKEEEAGTEEDKSEWREATDFVETLMEQAEQNGFIDKDVFG